MIEKTDITARVVLCTCADEASAASLAHGIIDARLAACVNVVPRIRSIYRWQHRVEDEAEALMVIKTTAARAAELEAWLLANHPYDVPELLILPVEQGSDAYLAWLIQETIPDVPQQN